MAGGARALYYDDAYRREFEATVVAVEDDGVVLDQTAFYPGGGGQPHDVGTLRWDGGEARVTAMRRAGEHLVHVLAGDRPAVGARVRGAIDWERRYRLMRYHTALHVLCGTIWREFGAQVTGCQMYPDRARMDFELADLSPERVRFIEERANAHAQAGLPVRSRLLPRAEAFQIPDLIRTKVNLLPEAIQEVRVVEIEGLDLQADGGTHVANTAEVGRLRITKTENKGKAFKRIEIVLE
jgi:misacylated tRNA(Ala) deacylase